MIHVEHTHRLASNAIQLLLGVWLGLCLMPQTSRAVFEKNSSVAEPSKRHSATERFGFSLLPQPKANWKFKPAFSDLSFYEPVQLVPAPDALEFKESYVVVGRRGTAWLINEEGTSKSEFLNLTDRMHQDPVESDDNFLSVAFPHDFAERASPVFRTCFAMYSCGEGNKHRYIVSKFEIPEGEFKADAASETVLISQPVPEKHHVGGALLFGDDGFLYVAIGDGSGDNDDRHNSQRIDKSLFSGILCIDVRRKGGEVSFPPQRQPASGFTKDYYIPRSNPFAANDKVLQEFWALGLRNPFRIAFDPLDSKKLWVGDVGQDTLESVVVATPGSNHGWSQLEGGQPFMHRSRKESTPIGVTGKKTPPRYTYPHANMDNCIVGGLVIPADSPHPLAGHYVFGDHGSGRIWSLPAEDKNATAEELCCVPQETGKIAGFTLTRDDEIAICIWKYNNPNGQFLILSPADQPKDSAPRTLSETGIFTDIQTMKPDAEFVHYEVNLPFWSEGAEKTRWISLPRHQQRYAPILFHEDSPWSFPPGTIFVKHFDSPTGSSKPGRSGQRLETRVIVRDLEDGISAYCYVWNEKQSDAILAETRKTIVIDEGKPSEFRWTTPSRIDCHICHNRSSGMILGVNTRQLAGRASQVVQWNQKGWFDKPLTDQHLADLPFHSQPGDTDTSREHRVRSYLDVNCSYCHSPENRVKANLDLRSTTSMHATGLFSSAVLKPFGKHKPAPVVMGSPDRSLVLHRFESNDLGVIMPPLLHSRIDPAGQKLLRNWITGASEEETTLPDWLKARSVKAETSTVNLAGHLEGFRHAQPLTPNPENFLYGATTPDTIRRTPAGIEVQALGAQPQQSPIGLRFPCKVSGDFHVFVPVELWEPEFSSEASWAAARLTIHSENGHSASHVLTLTPGGARRIAHSTKSSQQPGETSDQTAASVATDASKGILGISRKGEELVFTTGRSDAEPLQAVHFTKFSDEPINEIEVCIEVSGPGVRIRGALDQPQIFAERLELAPEDTERGGRLSVTLIASLALFATAGVLILLKRRSQP